MTTLFLVKVGAGTLGHPVDGNPENQIGPHILTRDVQKPINLKLDFQGSQNLHIRVAISHLDVMLQTQFCHRMFSS